MIFYKIIALALSVYSASFLLITDTASLPVQDPYRSIKQCFPKYFLKARTILNKFIKADRNEVNFNASYLATGVYIDRKRLNNFITVKKMVLLR